MYQQDETFEVGAIVGDRINNRKKEYKIRWKDYSEKYDSWEPEINLINDGVRDLIEEYNARKRRRP